MDWPETLDRFPYVRVGIACPWCTRKADYALVRLAVRFGPTVDLEHVLVALTQRCRYQRRLHPDGKTRPKYAPKWGLLHRSVGRGRARRASEGLTRTKGLRVL
jgi:hypothetical protein